MSISSNNDMSSSLVCDNCKQIIGNPASGSRFPECGHVFDFECITIIGRLLYEQYQRLHQHQQSESSSSSSSSSPLPSSSNLSQQQQQSITTFGCPICSGDLEMIKTSRLLIPVDSSIVASSSTTAHDLASSGHTLEQLKSSGINWEMLLSRGMTKRDLSRRNKWFDPTYFKTIGITIDRLITQLHFTAADLKSRKTTPQECEAIGCTADILLDKLKPTPRLFILFGFKFGDMVKYLKMTDKTLMRILMLAGEATSMVFVKLLLNVLQYTRQSISDTFPKFLQSLTNVDILSTLI
jgi:hypothetical protein